MPKLYQYCINVISPSQYIQHSLITTMPALVLDKIWSTTLLMQCVSLDACLSYTDIDKPNLDNELKDKNQKLHQ